MSITFGQASLELDTIKLLNIISNDMPICTSKDTLFTYLGYPDFIDTSITFRILPISIYSSVKDTFFVLNCFNYYDAGLSYLEKNGKVRLFDIDLKKHKKTIFTTDKMQLSYKFSLKQLMKVYKYTFEDIAPQLGIMAPYPMRKCRCFYRVDFSTGEQVLVNIELYVDCRK
jgi:hypothetical protein